MGQKPKSIIIDGETHQKFKMFCKGKSLKMGALVEDLLTLYMTKRHFIQEEIDKIKK